MKRLLPRFTLGSLLLMVVIVGMGVAWWLDHARLARELLNTQTRLAASELLAKAREVKLGAFGGYGFGGVSPAVTTGAFGGANPSAFGGGNAGAVQPPPASPYSTPGEFIEMLRETRDFDEFQTTMVEFVQTAIADEALPLLIALFEDPDPEVRARAVQTVGCMGGFYPAPPERWSRVEHVEAVVSSIVAMFKDKDENVRWTAVFVLGFTFGTKARSALPALQELMNGESSPVAAQAAEAIFRIDPSIDIEPRLQELLRNGDLVTRFRTIEVLRTIVQEKKIAKATRDALLEAYRAVELEPSKRSMAELLERIKAGPQPRVDKTRAAGQ